MITEAHGKNCIPYEKIEVKPQTETIKQLNTKNVGDCVDSTSGKPIVFVSIGLLGIMDYVIWKLV